MGDTKLENFECPCSLGPQCPSTLAKVRKHIEGLSMEPEETGPDCAKTSKLTCANLPTCDCHEPCLRTEYIDHALDELSKYCYATAPKGEATCVADGPDEVRAADFVYGFLYEVRAGGSHRVVPYSGVVLVGFGFGVVVAASAFGSAAKGFEEGLP